MKRLFTFLILASGWLYAQSPVTRIITYSTLPSTCSPPFGIAELTSPQEICSCNAAGNGFVCAAAGGGIISVTGAAPITASTSSGAVTVGCATCATYTGSTTSTHLAVWTSTTGQLDDGGAVPTGATLKTNGTNNSSQTTLNLINSSTNAVGLTLTQANTTGGTVQGEITGSSYTGNSATATALAASPTNCSAGSYTTGINASGTAQGCTALTTSTFTSTLKSETGSYTVLSTDFSGTGILTNVQFNVAYAHNTSFCGGACTFTLPASTSAPTDKYCVEISNNVATSGTVAMPLLLLPGSGTTLAGSSTSVTQALWGGSAVVVCYNSANTNYVVVSGQLAIPVKALYAGFTGTSVGTLTPNAINETAFSGFTVPWPGVVFSKLSSGSQTADATAESSFGILDTTDGLWWCQTSKVAIPTANTQMNASCSEGTIYLPPGTYVTAYTSAATTGKLYGLDTVIGIYYANNALSATSGTCGGVSSGGWGNTNACTMPAATGVTSIVPEFVLN